MQIYIHNLEDKEKKQSTMGNNPFDNFTITVGEDKKKISSIVKAYDPPYSISTNVYDYIKKNIEDLVEKAIKQGRCVS